MKSIKARINWVENNLLEGFTQSGHKVNMDSGVNSRFASPAELLLQSLAGCSMMDCVLIITKSRKKINKFWVDVEAQEADTYPRVYTKVHLTYNFTGEDLTCELINRAIILSHEKYCRIYAMLYRSIEITSSFNLNGKRNREVEPSMSNISTV